MDKVLATQVELRANGKQFVPKDKLPGNWSSAAYQKQIEADKLQSLKSQGPQQKTAGPP